MFATANPIVFFHLSVVPAGGARVSSARAPRPASLRVWWTIDELAAELAVNEKTIRRWIHKGDLVAKRVGKGLRIHRFAVTAMLEKNPVGPQPPKRRRGGQLKTEPPPWVQRLRESA